MTQAPIVPKAVNPLKTASNMLLTRIFSLHFNLSHSGRSSSTFCNDAFLLGEGAGGGIIILCNVTD